MSTQETPSSVTERFVGQVKWFNNKAGYGFITAREGEHIDKDIFVHFTTVSRDDKQYRYLVQGEYVEFAIAPSADSKYSIQAVSISGIKGGLLMFETRRAQRSDSDVARVRSSEPRSSVPDSEGDTTRPSGPRKYRTRRDDTEGGERRRRPVRRVKPETA